MMMLIRLKADAPTFRESKSFHLLIHNIAVIVVGLT